MGLRRPCTAPGREIRLPEPRSSFNWMTARTRKAKPTSKAISSFSVEKQDIVAARVKYVEQVSGEFEGKQYPEVRHYLTVTFDNDSAAEGRSRRRSSPLPPSRTCRWPSRASARAIVDNDPVRLRRQHRQGARLLRRHPVGQALPPQAANREVRWEELGTSEPAARVAMAARYGGKVYPRRRIQRPQQAGRKARSVLHRRIRHVRSPIRKSWSSLPSASRAALLTRRRRARRYDLYVVGGWSMQGERRPRPSGWRTAWAYDLSEGSLEAPGEEIAQPTSNRRALTLAAHQRQALRHRAACIRTGAATTETLVYDPGNRMPGRKDRNSPSEDGDGFGASAFADREDTSTSAASRASSCDSPAMNNAGSLSANWPKSASSIACFRCRTADCSSSAAPA
jgi:hypothetical protein